MLSEELVTNANQASGLSHTVNCVIAICEELLRRFAVRFVSISLSC
jgi:hypothetical protein